MDEKIILKYEYIFKKLDGSIDWIELTRNRDGLRTVVNTEIISVSVDCGE